MTLIVDILDRAARQCSVASPSNWVTVSGGVHAELLDFMSETVDDILSRIDTAAPVGATVTITGDGGETYPLPSDYKRVKRGEYAVYERYRTRRACVPVSDDGQWQYMQELGTAGAYRFFRIHGYEGAFEIDFYRPLETDLTVVVNYVSTNWAATAGGVVKSEFSLTDDVSLLPRRLLEAGIVWRFRERKGLDFTGKMAEYEAMLARMANDTKTVRGISFGPMRGRNPWDVPVPDFIPSGS